MLNVGSCMWVAQLPKIRETETSEKTRKIRSARKKTAPTLHTRYPFHSKRDEVLRKSARMAASIAETMRSITACTCPLRWRE